MGGGHVPEPSREALYEPSKRGYGTDSVIFKMIDTPTEWFKQNVTDRFRQKYPYYHRRYPRVPSIDSCYVDDFLCFYEANQQFKRDRLVDQEIVHILRRRKDECYLWYGRQRDLVEKHCGQITQDYEDSSTNYFIKYGDMGTIATAKTALMKQKHRMLWEQKNGEVGSRGDPTKWRRYTDPPDMSHEDNLVGNLRKFTSHTSAPKEMAP